MSSAYYSTRLWWYGHGGGAKLHGAEVALLEAPRIGGQVVTSVDYVPEIGLWRIQYPGEPPRDMRREPFDEVAACDALLRQLVWAPQSSTPSPDHGGAAC
ncbi:MAG: hypothetical protein N2688_00500 [Burkholderiaceae bacterium]|nr:hypothetical protein [Burkholderiaceae bacterium]